MTKEETENGRADSNGDDGGSSDGTITATTDGGQSKPNPAASNDRRNTDSESGNTGNPSDGTKATDSNLGDSATNRGVGGNEHEPSSVGANGESGDDAESSEQRRKRLRRERDRARREQLRNDTGDTGTSGTTGAGTSERKQVPSSVLPIKKQNKPKAVATKPTSTRTKGTRRNKNDIEESELSAFIIGVFNLLGGFMGAHWFVTEDEATQISEPLSRILNKQNAKRKTKVNDMMAPMLLITAIGSIVVPRLVLQTMEWREKADERKRQNNKARNNPPRIEPRKSAGETIPDRGSVDGLDSGDYSPVEENGHEDLNHVEYVPTVPSQIAGLFKDEH